LGFKRSKLEIIYDVLDSVANGSNTPTRLSRRANLSWVALQEFMDFLLSNRYVVARESESKRTYRLTEEGHKVLKRLRSLDNDLGPMFVSSMKDDQGPFSAYGPPLNAEPIRRHGPSR
jgi:predicted transcriptional regulator